MENINTGFRLFALTLSLLFIANSGAVFAEAAQNEKSKTKLEAFQQQTYMFGDFLVSGVMPMLQS